VCGRYVVKSPSAKLKVKFHLDDTPLFEPRYLGGRTRAANGIANETGRIV
jgi:hypothetical protein